MQPPNGDAATRFIMVCRFSWRILLFETPQRSTSRVFPRDWIAETTCTIVREDGARFRNYVTQNGVRLDGGRFLEIGSGEGDSALLIGEKTNSELYGLDYAPVAGKVAVEKAKENEKFIQADACALPFEDQYFNLL